MSWYVRETPDDVLSEAMTFTQAELVARDLSRTNQVGTIELLTYEGDRLFVVSIFLRGRKLVGGKRARDASRQGLPPRI